MQEVLQATDLLLLRHGGDLTLLGRKDLSHKAPNKQHKVAVFRLGFLGILNRTVFGELGWTDMHHPGHTGITLGWGMSNLMLRSGLTQGLLLVKVGRLS